MAKLKQVRALKSSGVEPLAPTLIKRILRILHALVLKGEDRRWASEIGRLSMLGELLRFRFARGAGRGLALKLSRASRVRPRQRFVFSAFRIAPFDCVGRQGGVEAGARSFFTSRFRRETETPSSSATGFKNALLPFAFSARTRTPAIRMTTPRPPRWRPR
jgi:hypothetical protein